MTYHIVPLRPDFLEKVRHAGIDDQNQPVERLTAQGGEPCRDVLRAAKPGEALILASYCPFTKTGPYKEYGPVFVLAESTSEHYDCQRLPLPQGNDSDYLGDTFVLRAYSHNERIVDARLSSPQQAKTDLNTLFANDQVSFVLVRYAAYGCYSFRLNRTA